MLTEKHKGGRAWKSDGRLEVSMLVLGQPRTHVIGSTQVRNRFYLFVWQVTVRAVIASRFSRDCVTPWDKEQRTHSARLCEAMKLSQRTSA